MRMAFDAPPRCDGLAGPMRHHVIEICRKDALHAEALNQAMDFLLLEGPWPVSVRRRGGCS